MEDGENSKAFVSEDLPSGLLYPPQNDKDDFQITRDELDQIQQALKNEKFRRMLDEYAKEVQDPENRKLFQSELRQLEKQHGNVVHFINPVAGYVLKTSVNGDKKAFINLCSNSMIRKVSFEKSVQGNVGGTMCSIPFAQSPMREDVDKEGRFCNVYDVVFNPGTLALAKVNETIGKQVETVALEAVENSFGVRLDKNNIRKPKLRYKGMKHATMIKYKIGDQPPHVLDPAQIKNEPLPEPEEPYYFRSNNNREQKQSELTKKCAVRQNSDIENEKPQKKSSKSVEWTEPKYNLKYRSHVDLQDFCLDNQREGRATKPIPEEIILTVDLPLVKDSSTLEADVLEGGWDFELKAERRAHYRLNLRLPFQVHCGKNKASFDVDRKKLIIVMKTVQKKVESLFSTDLQQECNNNNVMMKPPLQNRKDNFVTDEADGASSDSPSPPPEDFDSESSEGMKETAEETVEPEEDFVSLESLQEEDQSCSLGTSPKEKTVRFNEAVQEQLFRSNSSILGQRKKNQRKAKNKRKARGRLSSEGSVSSMDEDDLSIGGGEECGDGDVEVFQASKKFMKQELEQEE